MAFPRKRWTGQPTFATAGIWRGRQIEGILYGNDATTADTLVTRTSNALPLYTAKGRAWGSNSSTTMAHARMKNAFALATAATCQCTIAIVFRIVSGAGGMVLGGLGSDSGASGNTQVVFTMNGTGLRSYFLTAGGALPVDVTGTSDISAGRWHCGVISADFSASGAPYSLAVDGAIVGSGTRGATLAGTTTFEYVCAAGFVRGGAATAGSAIGHVAMVAPIFAKFSDSEIKELSLNPWQLFEPHNRRILFGQTAAAASFNAAWAMGNTVIHPGALNA